MDKPSTYTAFCGATRIATGSIEEVINGIKTSTIPEEGGSPILVFDNQTGKQFDLDLRGTTEEILERFQSTQKRRGRGRPKMGVECNELCLLPRHWEWLSAQPRSTSATVRRLIDAARKEETPEDRIREQTDAVGNFMWSMAGDQPGFEEATRSLYRGDLQEVRKQIAQWPVDVKKHIEMFLARIET